MGDCSIHVIGTSPRYAVECESTFICPISTKYSNCTTRIYSFTFYKLKHIIVRNGFQFCNCCYNSIRSFCGGGNSLRYTLIVYLVNPILKRRDVTIYQSKKSLSPENHREIEKSNFAKFNPQYKTTVLS